MARRGLINCYIDGHGGHAPYQTPISPLFAETNGYCNAYMSSEMFLTLYNFFNSSAAQSLGIQRRAYFQGGQTANLCYPMPEETTSSAAGTGMNYWDESNPVGNHAWAAFEFTLGSPSFWIMIQWGAASTAAVGNVTYGYTVDAPAFGLSGSTGASGSIGNPYLDTSLNIFNQTILSVPNHTRLGGVGISVGLMNDGSSPWNGTTNNNGADVKGSPIWKHNAMSWPRANNDTGMFASTKELMFGLMYEQNSVFKFGAVGGTRAGGPQRQTVSIGFDGGHAKTYDDASTLYHTIIEEDKICILIDHSGVGLYSMFYFGPYVPYVTGAIAPRIALHKFINNNDATPIVSVGNNQVYGGFDMGLVISSQQHPNQTSGDSAYHQGGVSHPTSASVVGCSLDTPFPYTNFDSPRRFQTDIRGPWLTMHALVYMNEFPERRSLLGEVQWFSLISNIPNGSLVNTGSLCVFGNPEMGSFKVLVPWFTGSIPGIYGSRLGQLR